MDILDQVVLKEVQSPDHAILLWINYKEQVSAAMEALFVEKIFAKTWTARSIFNAIEEKFPAVSTNPSQQQARRVLLDILLRSMRFIDQRR